MNTFLWKQRWMVIAVMTVLVAPVWSMTVQAAPPDPVPQEIRALTDAATALIAEAKTLATQASDIAQSAKADVQIANLNNPLPAAIEQKKTEAVGKITAAKQKIDEASRKIQEAKKLLTSSNFGAAP